MTTPKVGKVQPPIEKLVGMTTSDGWKITEKTSRSSIQTGGCFSVGYLVEHEDGRRGYLKALDFQQALNSADSARELQKMLTVYNFERDLLEFCNQNGMSRIVRAITSGSFDVPGAPLDKIYHLIFELADGDARTQASVVKRRDYAWASKMCHQVAVGMWQLHRAGITHQDLKPSNVLVFFNGSQSKLADLGRAHSDRLTAPHDELLMPGARTYAPPEQLYSYEPDNRLKARRAADLYLLGSMIMFGFSGSPMTPLIMAELRVEHRPFSVAQGDGWHGFFYDVLPYVREAWAICIENFEQRLVADLPRSAHKQVGNIAEIVRYLTDPDPDQRGHPQSKLRSPEKALDLERIVSRLSHTAAALSYIKRTS